jgi:Flp pilus assembly protein TadG
MKTTRYMNCLRASFLGRLLGDERGQVLPLMTFFIMSLLGMGALALDFGRAYVSFHQLQTSTDAAALAGAEQLPAATAVTTANAYSAGSGDKNAYNWMSGVSVTVTAKCLSTLTSQGLPCVSPESANALQVSESFNVPTYFARLFGINQIPISWTSTASMSGAGSTPYNIVIIADSTQSMNDTDSDSQCNNTRFICALSGIQTLLESNGVAPCTSVYQAAHGNCGTATAGSNGAGNVTSPVDEVALFTFPNVTTATVANDYSCGASNPTIATEYQYPVHNDTTYAPPGPAASYILGSGGTGDSSYNSTYQVVGFSSDYRTSDTTTTLNPASHLVMAIGGKTSCASMTAIGGLGTYYAGVLYAAQAALDAERASSGRSLSQNAIIIISDGDATSSQTQMGSTTGGATSGGSYPSWVDECGQAVTAAQYAASQGTRVYVVAYGAEASGCTTDTSGAYAGDTPCTILEDMASSPAYFFSDYTQSGSSTDSACIAAAASTSNLATIFQYIAGSLTASRLIPNTTT